MRLGELRDFTDAKNYPAALSLTDDLLALAAPDSYDAFVLSQVRAQIFLTQGRPADALPPLEASLRLADTHPFLDARPRLDLVYLVAQVAAQLATVAPDAATQRARFDQAGVLIRRWLVEAPLAAPGLRGEGGTVLADAHLFAASVLYNGALAATPPNPAQFTAALTEAGQGLALTVHPGEQFYVLMLASLQQLGDLARVAELLELLVSQHPANASYWQQLAATYLHLAAEAQDARAIRREQLRSLLALERAQGHGFLKAPADQYNLAGLYFNLGQPGQTIALLEPGLAAGLLAPDRRAWELLVRACQQSHQDARALAALEKAVARFPADTAFQLALTRLREALASAPPVAP